ncbi:helix-turn-helix domain-containing protein [Chryseobacterium sp. JM1]|uniref:helix-turn-helix domain-containing protein n=1 Tax=Chryseobacterium sp. JM1 TaxID=1233950 RepID=UPI0004E66918|nr:helix-turn-helix transcriptional regulator [Chryseobacterium sp. JM1]KFF15514.1 hypothetical protein IW22_24265 [Chryseobacterium sp. JM1]
MLQWFCFVRSTSETLAPAKGVDKSTYSKIEKGLREVTVTELTKMAKLFNLSVDQIINYDENVKPKEIVIEDKSTLEQMELIQQLDEEDKSTVFKIIDKMLTTKKFKDFFNKNVAAL